MSAISSIYGMFSRGAVSPTARRLPIIYNLLKIATEDSCNRNKKTYEQTYTYTQTNVRQHYTLLHKMIIW